MKIICTKNNFKKAIRIAETVVGKQITLPILENVLLETEKGMLKILATNLEIGISFKIGAKIKEEGKITIPAKLLGNFVANLPSGDGEIIFEVDNQVLKVKSDGYEAKIKALGAEDFPIIPELKSNFLFSLDPVILKNAIPKILPCISIDNSRLELGGVNLRFEKDKISLAATDSFRLAEVTIPIKSLNKDDYEAFVLKNESIIIPANTLAEVLRIIEGEDFEDLKIFMEESQIFFQIGPAKLVSRLINGKYPDYKQIIPKDFKTKTIVFKEEILRAVKIASLFAGNRTGEVSLNINYKSKEIIAMAQSEEKGENKSVISAITKGEDQELIFNSRYILDGINSVSSEKLAILANSGFSSVAIKMISEGDEIMDNFTYIVMPIKK